MTAREIRRVRLWHTRFLTHVLAAALARALAPLVQSLLRGVAVVNADACIDCGACEGACPTGAITAE